MSKYLVEVLLKILADFMQADAEACKRSLAEAAYGKTAPEAKKESSTDSND